MVVFEEMFEHADELSIMYKGRRLVLGHTVQIDGEETSLQLFVEHVGDRWEQGIMVGVPKGGRIEFEGDVLRMWAWIPATQADGQVVKIVGSAYYHIQNYWDTGSGQRQYGHNGAAILVEELGNRQTRYRCNDGYPDDDLNDLVFVVTQL